MYVVEQGQQGGGWRRGENGFYATDQANGDY